MWEEIKEGNEWNNGNGNGKCEPIEGRVGRKESLGKFIIFPLMGMNGKVLLYCTY